MKLLVISRLHAQQSVDSTFARYLESPDRNPPATVKRLGRWYSATFDTSYVILETPDLPTVSTWLRKWSGSTHEIIPVLDDADLAKSMDE